MKCRASIEAAKEFEKKYPEHIGTDWEKEVKNFRAKILSSYEDLLTFLWKAGLLNPASFKWIDREKMMYWLMEDWELLIFRHKTVHSDVYIIKATGEGGFRIQGEDD